MICLFCNKKCIKYSSNGYEKFGHSKCYINFNYHSLNKLITFETNKYAFAFYMNENLDKIRYSEIINKENRNYLSLDLVGCNILSIFEETDFESINTKLEEYFIYA